jgi:hypothetical protein
LASLRAAPEENWTLGNDNDNDNKEGKERCIREVMSLSSAR